MLQKQGELNFTYSLYIRVLISGGGEAIEYKRP
jgi:hypothetical protein